MKKHLSSLLFAAVFFVLCLIPSVGLLLTGGAKAGANEVLAPRPTLVKRNGSVNGDFLAGLADYVDDRFALRQEAVTAWARLNAGVFRTSVTDSVILGQGGWLYYAPTLPDFTRTDPMTERELWCAARTLYLLQEYTEEQGGTFLFTIAPNKNTLYPENMPPYPAEGTEANLAALQTHLQRMGVAFLDLAEVFGRQDEALYFPSDSHWNGKGAALAADAILTALGRESNYYAGPFAESRHTGDLYEMLYPAGNSADPDYVYSPGFSFTTDSANPDSITISASCAAGEGSLLMYRDSFGRNLYPYLAEAFSEAVFSRKNDYDPTALRSGGTLIVELVERNLRYLNTNPPTLPAAGREKISGQAVTALSSPEAELRLANGAPEGYTVLRGSFGTLTPDDDSPVYVSTSDGVFEAVPMPEGFSICLSADTATESLEVIFFRDENLVSLRGVILS